MSSLGVLDWLVCAGYFAVIGGIGLACARRRATPEQYYVGNRRMNWIAIGLSLFATSFSSLSFVGLPREAAYDDYHLYLAILFIPLWVAPIVGWLFIPLYHRLRLTSAYEYLERRFDIRLRLLGSLLFVLYSLGWMGSMLYAVGLILQAMLGLDEQQLIWTIVLVGLFTTFYTAVGGIEAVVWTDVIQAVVLVGSMLTVLFLTVGHIDGGWATVWRLGLEHDKFQMFDLHFDPTIRNNFYAACAYGVFVYLAAHSTSQNAVQRYVSMPTVSAARWSLVVNGISVAAGCLVFFVMGSCLFAYYHQAGGTFPQLARQDQLLPYFVLNVLPVPGVAGLLIAGLFTAAMSSMDSSINSLGAVVSCDWLRGRHLGTRASRLLCGLFGLLVIGTALLVPHLPGNVFDAIIMIAGALFGPLLGLFLLGILAPRADSAAAMVGLLAGALSLAVAIQTPVSHWWYGGLTCVPTFAVGTLASLLLAPAPPEKVRGLTLSQQASPHTENVLSEA